MNALFHKAATFETRVMQSTWCLLACTLHHVQVKAYVRLDTCKVTSKSGITLGWVGLELAVPITFVCLMPLQQSALQHSVFRWTTFKTLRLMISSMGMDTHSKRAACTTLPVYHLLVDMILGTITAQASHRAQSMWQDIKLWKPERTRSEQLSALADVSNRFKAAPQRCKNQNPWHPRY